MYEDLKAALLAQNLIPATEYAWATRPSGNYAVFQQDFEADADVGDDCKGGIAMEGSIDLFTKGRAPAIWTGIEAILTAHCGASWYLNTEVVDEATNMLHREYVFQTEE